MGVEGSASPADIIAAVEEAGYGASRKGAGTAGKGTAAAGSAGSSIAAAGGFVKRQRDACVEKETDRISLLPDSADVFFNGTYDVELAGPFLYGK